MPRRKRPVVKPLMPNWYTQDHTMFNNRHVEKGTELKIRGERGRFIFQRHVLNLDTESEWIDTICSKTRAFRSFRVDRIRTVHRKKLVRKNPLTAAA